MGKIEKLEAEVKALTPAEQAAFRDWYLAFQADSWDTQIERDSKGSKLSSLAADAVADYKNGNTKVL